MREIDEVRIILNRVFRRHSLNSPTVLARPVGQYTPDRDWPLGWFCHNHGFAYQTWSSIAMSINRITQDRFKLLSSIKLQAYGRGLLVRLRDLKLVTTRTQHFSGGYHFSGLRIKWDHDKLVERARGDRALRGSRTALETPKSAIWRGTTYNSRVDDNWLSGPGYRRRYVVPKGRTPKVWDRWITRRLKVEAHYNKRHRLGVKLLDFGEP
jgi:hypothetical protein